MGDKIIGRKKKGVRGRGKDEEERWRDILRLKIYKEEGERGGAEKPKIKL